MGMNEEFLNELSAINVDVNPLTLTGSILQFAAKFTSYPGGISSSVNSIIWPKESGLLDVWNQAREEITLLTNDEIPNKSWESFESLITQLQEKMGMFSSDLIFSNIVDAKIRYNDLLTFLSDFEDNFHVEGINFKYAFCPLFVAAVNIKFAFYIESIISSTRLELTADDVTLLDKHIHDTCISAQNYMNDVNIALQSYTDGTTDYYFDLCYYYGINATLPAKLWHSSYENFVSNMYIHNAYIPFIARGSFYDVIDNGNATYTAIEMSRKNIYASVQWPMSNMPYIDSKDHLIIPSYTKGQYFEGYISNIEISSDTSDIHKATGLRITESDDKHGIAYIMGLVGIDPVTGYNTTGIEQNFTSSSRINTVKVWSGDLESRGDFVSRLGFYAEDGTNIEAGEDNPIDTLTDVTVASPYDINKIYVPSDYACHENGSGHQMGGIAISVHYNNDEASLLVDNIIAVVDKYIKF